MYHSPITTAAGCERAVFNALRLEIAKHGPAISEPDWHGMSIPEQAAWLSRAIQGISDSLGEGGVETDG